MIGWANMSLKNGALDYKIGYVAAPPNDRTFKRNFDLEIDRMRVFLGLTAV